MSTLFLGFYDWLRLPPEVILLLSVLRAPGEKGT
jgi:hypothetical protein